MHMKFLLVAKPFLSLQFAKGLNGLSLLGRPTGLQITCRLKSSVRSRFSSERPAAIFCCSLSPRTSSNFSLVKSSICCCSCVKLLAFAGTVPLAKLSAKDACDPRPAAAQNLHTHGYCVTVCWLLRNSVQVGTSYWLLNPLMSPQDMFEALY